MLIPVSAKHYSIVALKNRAKTIITLIEKRDIAIKYDWTVKVEEKNRGEKKLLP